jgi:hypothetical protein
METDRMQVTYRTIFTEMLLAQAAAVGAFVFVSARYASLIEQECRALTSLAPETQRGRVAEPARPGESLTEPWPADFCRAFAGLPRVSMMSFLSHYDDLRGRRRLVRD